MRRFILITAISVLGALAVASVPASAAYKVQTARFRVTLSGKQTSSWTLNQSSSCGTVTGSGDQTFTYHQTRAITLAFTRYLHHPEGMPWVDLPKGMLGIPVAGTATRAGKMNSDTTNPNCRGTPIGPPQAPPQPDCGTVRYAGSFDVRWYRPQDFPSVGDEPAPLDNALRLDEERPQLPFFHCPFFGPLAIQTMTYALIPDRKLFGTAKRLILKPRLVHRVFEPGKLAPGVRAEATVGWEMHLTRLG